MAFWRERQGERIEGVHYVWEGGYKVPISHVPKAEESSDMDASLSHSSERDFPPTQVEIPCYGSRHPIALKKTARKSPRKGVKLEADVPVSPRAILPDKRGRGRPRGRGKSKVSTEVVPTKTNMHLRSNVSKKAEAQLPQKKLKGPQRPSKQQNVNVSQSSASGNSAQQSEGSDIGKKLNKTMLKTVGQEISRLKAEFERNIEQAQRTCRKLHSLENWILCGEHVK